MKIIRDDLGLCKPTNEGYLFITKNDSGFKYYPAVDLTW